MKKFLAIALFLVLVASVLVVASGAAETEYWDVNRNCLVKVKGIEDEEGNITVPTFKAVEENNSGYDGLIVGLPTYATVGDEFFESKEGYYFIYADANGDDHLGTADKIVVYDENDEIAATYGIVTYGDADGDGIFDVIDSAIAARCLNGFLDAADEPAVYEAVKPRAGVNNELVDILDYQMIVNDGIASEVEENLKGRKTPIDETLYFESVIYENTGATRVAEFTAEDNNFKGLVTNIYYNGSDEVLPKESGIYSVTALVSDSDKYLVTPGERNLGFIVIAPKAEVGYTITADNSNKKIVVGTTDNDTSNATLSAEFEKWLNSAYTLTVGGVTNPSEVSSVLPNRIFEVYSGQTSTLVKTEKNDVLGSYLPDDETLWANNTANNSKVVNVADDDKTFDFTIVFQQDEKAVEKAKLTYFADCAAASRGQRSDSNTTLHLYAKEINGMPAIKAAVKDSSAKIRSALGGTGLKGVLVGRADAISFQSSTTTDFSGATVTSLYDENGVKYSTLNLSLASDYSNLSEVKTNAEKVIPVVNSVLKGLGCSEISSSVFKLISQTIADLNIIDKSGYCNYRCSGESSSLRYNIAFYLEFKDYNTTEDGHNTLTVGSNVTMVTPTTSDKYDVYSRMAGNEIIMATAPAGYKLKVTDASGNEIPMQDEGYFLMPYSNATISAVAE